MNAQTVINKLVNPNVAALYLRKIQPLIQKGKTLTPDIMQEFAEMTGTKVSRDTTPKIHNSFLGSSTLKFPQAWTIDDIAEKNKLSQAAARVKLNALLKVGQVQKVGKIPQGRGRSKFAYQLTPLFFASHN